MTNAPVRTHIWVRGDDHPDRRRQLLDERAVDHHADCHRRLRGPYSGIGVLLRTIVTDAQRSHPDLLRRHQISLVYSNPDLSEILGPTPRMLVEVTPHEERTRYFGKAYIRGVSQDLTTFLIAYAEELRHDRGRPLTLVFDQIDEAEVTEQELLAMLIRRAPLHALHLRLGSATRPEFAELVNALLMCELRTTISSNAFTEATVSNEILADRFVESDGTSENRAELAAYYALPERDRQLLHDARADELETIGDHGLNVGAIPYHRERGSDPSGTGRLALRWALEFCVAYGYSNATVDFGLRGRAVSDPNEHQQDYCHFTAKAASALVPLDRLTECEGLYRDLMRRYDRPRVHMTCNYAIAMLHTRFYTPRDHEAALERINCARAFASLETDPIEGPYLQVYQDNGLALIEMHRGNLEHALELVARGFDRLEREIPPDRFMVHRTQLIHNRARLFVAAGRWADAEADFDELTARDPFYVEYYVDRGNVRANRGDLVGALADYDSAIAVSPPFAEVYFNRANLRAEAGDLSGAIEDLNYILEMEPDFTTARLNRGELLLELGDASAAKRDAEDGLASGSEDPLMLCLLGLAEETLGCPNEAHRAYSQAISDYPECFAAYVQRGVLAFEGGDIVGAVADFNAALEVKANDLDALFNRGVALQALGRFEDAIDDFNMAQGVPGADLAAITERLDECTYASFSQ